MAFLDFKDSSGNIPVQSGINWGQSSGNVRNSDAYIPIRVSVIRDNPGFFPVANPDNNIVNVDWDDGTTMSMQFEGTQDIGEISYVKQLSSHPYKDTLGNYLRRRMKIYDNNGNISNRLITLSDFSKYGTTGIELTYNSSTNRYNCTFK